MEFSKLIARGRLECDQNAAGRNKHSDEPGLQESDTAGLIVIYYNVEKLPGVFVFVLFILPMHASGFHSLLCTHKAKSYHYVTIDIFGFMHYKKMGVV